MNIISLELELLFRHFILVTWPNYKYHSLVHFILTKHFFRSWVLDSISLHWLHDSTVQLIYTLPTLPTPWCWMAGIAPTPFYERVRPPRFIMYMRGGGKVYRNLSKQLQTWDKHSHCLFDQACVTTKHLPIQGEIQV